MTRIGPEFATAGDSPFLQALYRVQESPLALWISQSSWALFFFLIVHTVSMGLLSGTGMVLCARVLGVARGVPLSRTIRILPLMGFCLILAISSGLFLVIAYPAKALTNGVFYAKLGMVLSALVLTTLLAQGPIRSGRYDRTAAPAAVKVIAVAVIALWVCAITAGRFLAYTQQVTLLLP